MANRIGTFPTFANLSPPWSLATLDSNFVSVNSLGNDSSLGYNNVGTDSGTSNSYVITLAFGVPSAYNQGMLVSFTPLNSNTGPSNITVNPLGSVQILSSSGTMLSSGQITAGTTVTMQYVGTAFRLLGSGSGGGGGGILNSTNAITTAGSTVTINCLGYSGVIVFADATGAPGSAATTFSLTNLAAGIPIDACILPGNVNQTFKWSATTPGSITYTTIRVVYGFSGYNPGSTTFTLITGGDSAANHIVYRGVANLNPVSSAYQIVFMGASF